MKFNSKCYKEYDSSATGIGGKTRWAFTYAQSMIKQRWETILLLFFYIGGTKNFIDINIFEVYKMSVIQVSSKITSSEVFLTPHPENSSTISQFHFPNTTLNHGVPSSTTLFIASL